ncbi:Fis family transcriptional regulator [Methylacidiphilum sp. Yel]|jgi:two-component system nitrogen regulation response regulator GlnG|uniref:sigma-54-dependent transcriptional regulator n=1 Tax=Methylacidiphilum sp. Yel TaxID=1847730 RepID=UPI00106A70F3|nr:sigma-54 dependent transcriptional regulator [Methylacidiphilum sp. Yel]TFE69776.1 Fis family transcriptional regulator [Methylacidiphilum sp. Yel]
MMKEKVTSLRSTPAENSFVQSILIVDDEEDVFYSFQRFLEAFPLKAYNAKSGEEALKFLRSNAVDIVLMDIRMGGKNGLETLKEIRKLSPQQIVIIMTAYGTCQTAIEAMKLGAYDYILKPFNILELKSILMKAMEASKLTKEASKESPHSSVDRHGLQIIGNSPAMQKVYKLIGQVAPTNATVLIVGESGSGKELVARAIYQYSLRSNRPFIAINCAAIPENLLESELFGHERGSFTGAMAQRIGKFEQGDGGTVFLDEIGEMPITTQAKILRVLQEGEFCRLGSNEPIKTDVRIIAATNKDLAAAVAKREFRADLYYRLNVVKLTLPPLRERVEDIPALVDHFLAKHRRYLPNAASRVSQDAIKHLMAYHWPGNIRELENVIQRAMVLATSATIQSCHLPEEIRFYEKIKESKKTSSVEHFSKELNALIEEIVAAERKENRIENLKTLFHWIYNHVLEECGGNESKAKEILGFHPSSVDAIK